MHLEILFLDWYDLDRGVAHLGRGVAQLGQEQSFLAEINETLLAEAYVLTRGHYLPECPCHLTCYTHFVMLLSCHSVTFFRKPNPAAPRVPAEV